MPVTASRGLLIPLRRDEVNDFASGTGEDLLRTRLLLALSTRVGEVQWRSDFGSSLSLLRHGPADEAAEELARYYAQEAVAAWVPSATVTSVTATREGTEGAALRLAVAYQASGAVGEVAVTP